MLCSNKHHFCRDDDELIGLLTSRSKAQLGRVDKFYRLKYDMCIAEQIADECSGDYKTFLTAMCKPQAIVDALNFAKATCLMRTRPAVVLRITRPIHS